MPSGIREPLQGPPCNTPAPELNDLLSTPAVHGLAYPKALHLCSHFICWPQHPPTKTEWCPLEVGRVRDPEDVMPQSLEFMDTLPYTPIRDFADVIKVRDLELGTLSWIFRPNLITWVLNIREPFPARRSWERQCEKSVLYCRMWRWRVWPLEADKGRETDAHREPPERNTALQTPWLRPGGSCAELLTYGTVSQYSRVVSYHCVVVCYSSYRNEYTAFPWFTERIKSVDKIKTYSSTLSFYLWYSYCPIT